MINDLRKTLASKANPAKAKILSSFFKTGPGQYGEGDKFLGITVPQQRVVAKQFAQLPLKDIETLLKSPIHEERLVAVLILVDRFKAGNDAERKTIYTFYLKNATRINNWDLVDASAHHIVGAYLHGKSHAPLLELAKSDILWERRIAMVATWHAIQKGEHKQAFAVAKALLQDEHDLMHKAVGWMLREVGKRASRQALENFLLEHHKTMPRTALRYAIEHFSPKQRQLYLKGLVV